MAENDSPESQGSSTFKPRRKPMWVSEHGLTLLYEPATPNFTIADLVFVHGLQGHPYKTWLYKGKVEKKVYNENAKSSRQWGVLSRKSKQWQTITERRNAFWPRDSLPDDIPNIRIFTFGYDSHISRGFYGPANRSNISQHGLTLLNAVSKIRHGCQDRPLIFVAHSLGGLIVKQALVEAWKAKADGQPRNLHEECRAVIFFGTPHRGSPDASWGIVMANIAKAARFDSNKSILNDLNPSSGSSTLSILQDDFNGLLRREGIKIYSFQEAAGKYYYGLNSKVVPDESSVIGFRDVEMRDTINANHMEMCRFQSREDDGYQKTLGALKGFLHTFAGEKRRSADEVHANFEQKRQELLANLDFAERTARETQIQNTDAQATTTDWLWTINQSQESFTDWLSSDPSIYWIRGKPGSGKSTLVGYLISHTSEIKKMLSVSERTWEVIHFFFDFRAGKGIANDIIGLLRSLCLQVVKTMSDSDHGLEKLLNELEDAQWNITTLRNTLSRLIQQSPSSLCIFIDGLDEYQGPMHELLETLLNISSGADGGRKLKLCLASRPEPIIDKTLSSYPGLAMHDHNKEAIEQYVSASIKNLRWSSEDEWRLLQISSIIAHKAEGIFLWARFALSELVESHAIEESSDDLYRRLDSLPVSMEDLYANMFKGMRPQDRDDAQLLFQLVCSSSSALTVRQLTEAEAVANDRSNDIQLEYEDVLLNAYARRVQAKSAGLLECVTDRYDKDSQRPGYKRVKTLHRSVISFLERQQWLTNCNVRGQAFRSQNALWVYICCKYLRNFFRDHSVELDEGELEMEFTPTSLYSSLSDYCREYLFEHARRMEWGCNYRDEQHLGNISHAESAFEYLCLVPDTIWSKLGPFFSSTFGLSVVMDWATIKTCRKSQPWQLMVEHGLHLTVEKALSSGKYSVIPHGYDISLVLSGWARTYTKATWHEFVCDTTYGLYHQLIVTLIKHGARPGTKDIIMCLNFGQRCTLEKLLETWPNGRIKLSRGKLYVSESITKDQKENYTYNGEAVGPLRELALMRRLPGFESILDYFLSRGEDINARCGPRGTMLHAIIIHCGSNNIYDTPHSEGFEDMSKALIKRGADVDVRGTWGTPLQMAWKMLRYCYAEEGIYKLLKIQAIMFLLRDHGANCEWIEPDGTIVTREDIDAWCSMNWEQLLQQNEPRFRPPGYYTWETLPAPASLWEAGFH